MTIEFIQRLAESVKGWGREQLNEEGGLFPPSKYYAFFKILAEQMKPKVAVVLGVCGGGDCYHLAKGNPEGKVIGVDIAYDHPIQLEFIKANCPNFEFWLGDAVASAKGVFDKYGQIDFLFVDTSHDEGTALAEWEAWKSYLAPSAVVCFDDIFRPGMQEAWETLPQPKIRLDWLHDGQYPEGGGFGAVLMPPYPVTYASILIPPEGPEMGN